MANDQRDVETTAAEVYRTIFGEGFELPSPRLPESTEAATPRRTAQRLLLANDIISLKIRAVAIFTATTALGMKSASKLWMQGLRNLGFSNREIAELVETIGLYAGVPRAVDAHISLNELVEEDKDRDHAAGFYHVPPGQ